MFFEHLGDSNGHGAVEKGGDGIDFFFEKKFVEVIKNFLGPFDGEAGYDDVSAGGAGFVDDAGERFFDFKGVRMFAIAVGRFDDDVIGVFKEGRVAEDGFVFSADVTGEDNGALGSITSGFKFDHGGAEDVSGVVKSCLDGIGDIGGFFVFNRSIEFGAFLGVFGIVKGHDGARSSATFFLMPFEFVGGVFHLQMGRIEQDDLGDFGGGLGAEYFTVEAVLDEFGQIAAVVEVGVGQEYRVDGRGRYGQGIPVSIEELSFLVESTIDENSCVVGFDEVS